jgi:glutamate decarboxylase
MRIVCRNGLSHDLADDVLADIVAETEFLDSLDAPMPHPGIGPTFHH